jgi:hypothetical protein
VEEQKDTRCDQGIEGQLLEEEEENSTCNSKVFKE